MLRRQKNRYPEDIKLVVSGPLGGYETDDEHVTLPMTLC